jgi:hypothetical protein
MTKREKLETSSIGLDIHLTEHCNLNCKGCAHFSPLAKSEFLNIEVFTKDMQRLGELSKEKDFALRLSGGEVLLNKNINSFIMIAREFIPKGSIQIDTNGILLATKDDTFFEVCKKHNIKIMVTKYPLKIDWTMIRRKCREKLIPLRLIGVMKRDGFSITDNGIKTLDKYTIEPDGVNKIENSFNECYLGSQCTQLRNGYIYTCPLPANIHHLNRYFNLDFKVTEEDRINIHSIKDVNEIIEYLSNPIPFCRYCNIEKWEHNLPFQLSERKVDEWIG